MRRSRRIDVWRDGDQIRVDAMFQDSASTPSGTRKAIHEYSLEVSADARSLTLTRVHATPRILPFPECPAAAKNINRLLGVPLRYLRAAVREHDNACGCGRHCQLALQVRRPNLHREGAACDADARNLRTSSSLVCEKSSYHVLTA